MLIGAMLGKTLDDWCGGMRILRRHTWHRMRRSLQIFSAAQVRQIQTTRVANYLLTS